MLISPPDEEYRSRPHSGEGFGARRCTEPPPARCWALGGRGCGAFFGAYRGAAYPRLCRYAPYTARLLRVGLSMLRILACSRLPEMSYVCAGDLNVRGHPLRSDSPLAASELPRARPQTSGCARLFHALVAGRFPPSLELLGRLLGGGAGGCSWPPRTGCHMSGSHNAPCRCLKGAVEGQWHCGFFRRGVAARCR